MKFLYTFTFILICSLVFAQKSGSINGKIVDKNTQEVLPFVNLQILGTSKGATSDDLGKFRITDIPVGTHNIKFSYVGYKDLILYNIVINSGNESTFQIELEQSSNNLTELEVTAKKETAFTGTLESPLSIQKLTAEEIKANPGGNFDISKVIQILPGVGGGVGGGSFRNDIIIRGGASNENVFYLDGIEVPVINHFQTQGSSGGPQGMLNVSFIEDVKLSSSAFDAKYDNALSSVFQFKQKTGNPNQLQGNVRLSATELATTLEGPINDKTTFLASARRSYLQLLFKAIDLPIRPNYWDFQTKITHQIDKKTSLIFVGLGAIDEFSFAIPEDYSAEKAQIINSSPSINQWNYTVGVSLKRLINNGYWNLALSRNMFNNNIVKYEDNEAPENSPKTLDLNSREAENKLRFDINQNINNWKISYGLSSQLVKYTNQTFNVIRKEVIDANGNLVQPKVSINFESPLNPFVKYGAFVQVGKRMSKFGFSGGLRTDMNTFTTSGRNPIKTLSPRVSMSYYINNQWSINASAGRYSKLPPYTILGFANSKGSLVNQNAEYQISNHLVGGVEFLPNESQRFTLEGFYKYYQNMPISKANGISLANLGTDFNVLGNEEVLFTGKGKTYGIEFFAQKKLTKRFFGVYSYTFYRSLFSGTDGKMISSSWDNRHLMSFAMGYKFKKNWELGLKFRYQGGAPYSPIDETTSKLNYVTQGVTFYDYSRLNTLRLGAFNSSDIRIDKKINFKKTALDLYIDVTNWYLAKSPAVPEFTLKRNENNTGFQTTDGLPLKSDASNGVSVIVNDPSALVTPTIGFIWEF
ncbi:TonB-dependent receptor [Lacihabitans sp. LS3-19]|uniref:TonB-dependent receptor n=1 Tax=Lacihabitans sp. LS3-19 TaxID=2487335 RepID=UPI0020CF5DD3|nr:TonB-dependent receptor [Lacihabitans sp. LS3-19]MCP9769856.1 TonB-dependent receptor [Lacihabitans sp. LS3-19]